MQEFRKIPIGKNIYESFHDESLLIDLTCPNCHEQFRFDLLGGYQLLENLVVKQNVSKELIIKNGMAQLATKMYSHLGIFAVQGNLPAYFKLFSCSKCESNFIAVFGLGESQPGRDLLLVSGIWEIIR